MTKPTKHFNLQLLVLKTTLTVAHLHTNRFKLIRWVGFVLSSICFVALYNNAESQRQYYFNNWCGTGNWNDPILVNDTCLYFVGNVWDYLFLTSSAFHSGFSLWHVGMLTGLLGILLANQLEILRRLR